MSVIALQQGDVGTEFLRYLRDQDGNPLDLTNATVTFRFKRPDDSAEDKTGEIVSATDGTVRYVATPDFLDAEGEWSFQVIVVYDTNNTWRTGVTTFTVKGNL